MKNIIIFSLVILSLFSCKNENAIEEDIAKIDVNFNVERFDFAFANTEPEGLPELKTAFPFLFPESIPDSIWFERMQDSNQILLNKVTREKFTDFKAETNDIQNLFQHLKYYDKTFRTPRVITLTNFVKYREKLAVTDHQIYSGIQKYLSANMKPSQIVVDMAKAYAEKQIFQSQKKTLLDEMVDFGKQLYFKDKVIPFKTDAEKIGYTPEQLEFAKANENMIWTKFVEDEMLYDTDSSLPARFIADAPFSKFYLELDNESPGRLGQYIGWQIVRAYVERTGEDVMKVLQKKPEDIFRISKFKPKK